MIERMKKINKLDNSGATAIEYALIASLIAVAAIAGMRVVGDSMKNKFQEISTSISGAS